MKHKSKLIIISLTSILLFASCGNNQTSSEDLSNISENLSGDNSSSVFEGYVSLEKAIKNTKYYALINDTLDNNSLIETYLSDMYYKSISKGGYVEINDDKGYLHAFSTILKEQDELEYDMLVYGRNGLVSNIDDLYYQTLINLIDNYSGSFSKKDDGVYSTDNTSFINTISDYFEGKLYKYATEIEIALNQNNRIESFIIYEDTTPLLKTKFLDINKEDINMYKSWKQNGSNVELRIYDLKNLKDENNKMTSLYEDVVVEFDAIVASKDSYNNIYVSNLDSNVGHIGIKIDSPSNYSSLSIKDVVHVKGKVKTENYNAYIVDATIIDSNVDSSYIPYFDEESLIYSNGGGVYAAQLFAGYPYFNDSIYTTYGYVESIDDSLSTNGDTVVTMIFPNQISDTDVYHMEVIIPNNLDNDVKNSIFSNLKNAGLYSNENKDEVCLDKFIIKYDYNYDYKIKLMATSSSSCYKKEEVEEKVNKYFGLSSFPLIEEKASSSYKYGNHLTASLENEYGVEDNYLEGLFVAFFDVTTDDINDYFTKLENYGFVKVDEIRDLYGRKHTIYQINDSINVDMMSIINNTDDNFTLNIWIYEGEVIKGKMILDRIDDIIGDWFNINDFYKLNGTFDADYSIFELREYAGEFYDESPIFCVAIDTQNKIIDDYCKGLINLGYKQYRVGNKAYTYKTRGQIHYVFYKNDVYLDVASYHTSDYTYSGHDEFEYRLEILIYKGNVLNIKTYDDLSVLSSLYSSIDSSLAYNVALPDDAVVEIWRDYNDFSIVDVNYGYGCRNEAFVYTSDVDAAYSAIKTGLINANYSIVNSEKESSVLFSKTIKGEAYYVLVLKENDKGYVRVFNGIGGIDFYR